METAWSRSQPRRGEHDQAQLRAGRVAGELVADQLRVLGRAGGHTQGQDPEGKREDWHSCGLQAAERVAAVPGLQRGPPCRQQAGHAQQPEREQQPAEEAALPGADGVLQRAPLVSPGPARGGGGQQQQLGYRPPARGQVAQRAKDPEHRVGL